MEAGTIAQVSMAPHWLAGTRTILVWTMGVTKAARLSRNGMGGGNWDGRSQGAGSATVSD
jgi:hypothetical protein